VPCRLTVETEKLPKVTAFVYGFVIHNSPGLVEMQFKLTILHAEKSRDSAVNVVTWLLDERPGNRRSISSRDKLLASPDLPL
jgi:hypothetical protein